MCISVLTFISDKKLREVIEFHIHEKKKQIIGIATNIMGLGHWYSRSKHFFFSKIC